MGKKTLLLSILIGAIGTSVNLIFTPSLELNPQNLQGKTYLVTGCTPNGIGYEVAKVLVEWNAKKVVCTMRDEKKSIELKSKLQTQVKREDFSSAFDVEVMELTDFESVRSGATRILNKYPKFDGIVLNAGLSLGDQRITKDGFDEVFQVNHLSQFLLIRLLENHLAQNARVLFMSSTGYLTGYLDKEAYGKKPGGRKFSSGSYNHLGVYGDTKLMQVLTAREFSKRFSRKDVSFNSVCPGFVATGFQEKMGDHIFARIVRFIQMFYARTPPPRGKSTDPSFNGSKVLSTQWGFR